MNKKIKKFNAYTLAEVLITLGVIGVVAAVTMPTLIKKYQSMVLSKQLNSMYSLISQAFISTKQELGSNSVFNEYTVYNSTLGYYKRDEFLDAFYKKLKVVRTLSASEIPKYSTYSSSNIEYRSTNSAFSVTYPNRLLPNGTTIHAWVGRDYDGTRIYFLIDVNGVKKPNRYGYDLFCFIINTPDDKLSGRKKVRDYSEEELENLNSPFNDLFGHPCSRNSKQSTNGEGCAWYALRDICPDDESKGYWECLPN